MIFTLDSSVSLKGVYKGYSVLGIHKDDTPWFSRCILDHTGKGSSTSVANVVRKKFTEVRRCPVLFDDYFFVGLTKKEAKYVYTCVEEYLKYHPNSNHAQQVMKDFDSWAIW